MIADIISAFQIPPVILVLCYALGTAVFIGLAQWSRERALYFRASQSKWAFISAWMVRGFIAVIFFSVSVQGGLWEGYIPHPENPSLVAELVLLIVITVLYLGIQTRRKGMKDAFYETGLEVPRVLAFMALFVLIWAASSLLFLVLFNLHTGLVFALPALEGILEPMRDIVLVIGMIWLLPYMYWYQRSRQLYREDHQTPPKLYKFHTLLWPIVIGLVFFIMPLFFEQVARAGKLQEMMNTKPPLERI
ncbi:MAG: hypothetical protein ACLFR0_05740 [Alphaproteobacteria bacterium]